MLMSNIAAKLVEKGIQPSAQRVAVAEYVLSTDEHPSADQVLARIKANFPYISRATVYNTLNLFVEKGLLRELYLAEGRIVFDPNISMHHHFIDESSGAILDIPWDSVKVSNVENLEFEVKDYQVVLRGRQKRS
jgi:Fur family transcriptional regulator, iron response regulator